ncbi:MAG: polynucleotide adenylyltransferase PcnB, partial [Caldimonas sp.]
FTLVEQPRFRAGFDFLRLRADAGEIDPALARWWEEFSQADEAGRRRLLEAVREQQAPARRSPGRRKPARPEALGEAAAQGDDAGAPAAPPGEDGTPARKRRRRRRKSAAAAAPATGNAD